jgi:predicted DNA-binding protein
MPVTHQRPITAFPTADLRKRIDDYSRKTGIPISEIVRRALDKYVPKQSPSDTKEE